MKKVKEKKEVILTSCIVIKRTLNIILFNTGMKVQVDKRITLAQLKEELVPLIGVPPTGFRLYRIRHANQEYELKSFERLRNLMDQSKVFLCFLFTFLFLSYLHVL